MFFFLSVFFSQHSSNVRDWVLIFGPNFFLKVLHITAQNHMAENPPLRLVKAMSNSEKNIVNTRNGFWHIQNLFQKLLLKVQYLLFLYKLIEKSFMDLRQKKKTEKWSFFWKYDLFWGLTVLTFVVKNDRFYGNWADSLSIFGETNFKFCGNCWSN